MQYLQLGEINIEITRKRIKNLHLRVNSNSGEVRISAPLKISDAVIRHFAYSHLEWIRKQRAKVLSRPKEPHHIYNSGEEIRYLGKCYKLNVFENGKNPKVILDESSIHLFIKPNSSIQKKHLIIEKFYRAQLQDLIPGLISKWELILGVSVDHFGIKRMKTKWGTCNIRAKRIWINLELIKKPIICLEYIIVHEMVHLLERNHNKSFYNILHYHFPHWKSIKEELNQRIYISE